ncbi:urease accessory protein UreH domain-containing protein [[Clostridium] fimetarium]|uniref:Sulfite exporter TauE/SafE n=1 Tax=[Clostridium] fimetarium TaxID=99656 RepID=A0A1I0M6D5_9FIRM|nr:sulfite exporter TauE/SafE family protein [[Clostridium] fimetarium]SEV84025.1 Sulfite exporter TauE/SafE [[Clostridium] fimetarium]
MGNSIIKKAFKLDGLTCTSCETRIENKLIKMDGVQEAEVSYVTSILQITYDSDKVSIEEIIKTIEKLDYNVRKDITETDYEIGKNPKNSSDSSNTTNTTNSSNSTNPNSQLIIIGVMILGAYMIIKHTIGFNLIPDINPNMGYGILFVVGLLTSLHCVAMCGGINLSVCVSYKFDKDKDSKFSKLKPSLMYNAGRVISYTIIGGIVGALGSVFSISNTGSAFISILAGGFMVIMGLNMLNIFPSLRKLNPHMPKAFANKIHSEKKNKGPFVVGLLNGLMPCGPLQAMQLYALGTGSFIAGSISMLAFSLGTVPLLFAFGALGSLLSSKFSKNMIKASAMIVIVLGFVMVNRGVAFTGFSMNSFAAQSSSNSSSDSQNTAVVNNNVQEIKSTLESGQYPAITVQAGVPVKWTITADAKNLNGCNNQIVIPQYNVEQKLVVGENVILFTPIKAGTFGYSCWMGMIRSNITVVEDLKSSAVNPGTESSTNVDNTGIPKGCCGY